MSLRKVFAALAGIVLLAAGCGVDSSGVISGLAAPSGDVRTANGTMLYFVAHGTLSVVQRGGGQLSAEERLALLVAGPTDDERARGFGSEVPAGALFGVQPGYGGVTVSSSVDVTRLSTMAVDQIVCTLSDNGTSVTLISDGQVRGPRTCPLPGVGAILPPRPSTAAGTLRRGSSGVRSASVRWHTSGTDRNRSHAG